LGAASWLANVKRAVHSVAAAGTFCPSGRHSGV